MKLTRNQQNCINLSILGDKLSYFNGLPFTRISNNNIKYKKELISNEFKKLNSINLKNWQSSINHFFLDNLYQILKNNKISTINNLIKLYKKEILNIKFIKKKLKYKYLNINHRIRSDILNTYINPYMHINKKTRKLLKLNKTIHTPTDENLQIGILIGIIFNNKKYNKSREIVSIALAKATHSHPYNYLSVFTLANIISYTIIHKYNINEGLLESNTYLQKTYICKNKLECKFVKKYNKFIVNLIDLKKGVINIKLNNIKPIKTALDTLIFSISIYLGSPDNWKLLLTNACIEKYTTPNTGAIVCGIYGLINGTKNVHKNMLK